MDNIQKAKNGDADAIQETILSCWEIITQLKEKRKMDFISNDIIGIMAGYVILKL